MYPSLVVGSWSIPTYFLILSLVFTTLVLCWQWQLSFFSEDVQVFARLLPVVILSGGFIGARALHVVAEGEGMYWKYPQYIFAIWSGGFVFYGGLLSGFVCGRLWHIYFFTKKLQASRLDGSASSGGLDSSGSLGGAGGSGGAIGLGGSGSLDKSDEFDSKRHGSRHSSVAQDASASKDGGSTAGYSLDFNRDVNPNLRSESDWRVWADRLWPYCNLGYAFGRLACLFNGCCYGTKCDLPWSLDGRHPVQLYVVMWELGLFLWLWSLRAKSTKPAGWIFFLWVLGHATGRFWMETLRDDPRGDSFLGFSQGSWISLVLVGWAIFHLLQARRRKILQ